MIRSRDATSTIQDFFQTVINLVKSSQIQDAKVLFEHLDEPKETCLGLSKSEDPIGKGVGKTDTARMFTRIIKSKAIQSGLVENLEDTSIFVNRIGPDKLSDMATNIIRRNLIDYTKQQCHLWNVPLQSAPSGYFWDKSSGSWMTQYEQMLVLNGKIILLVPKAVVSYKSQHTPAKYHQHFVLNFLQ